MVTAVLSNAMSGLRTVQTLLGTTTRNIVNANSEGYTRKVQAAVTGPAGGVLSGTVRRATDELLTQQLRTDIAARSGAETLLSALDRIDRLAGDPTRGDSLSGRMSALADSLQRIASDPINELGYAEVIDSAKALAATFRDTAFEIGRIAREAREAIPDDVAEANDLIARIAEINRQVTASEALGNDETDLLDQRDRLLGRLSEIMTVRGYVDQRNVFHLYTADHKLLADESARTLSTDLDGNVYVGSNRVREVGGRSGARREIVDRIAPALTAQLDDLAGRLTEGLAAVGLPLFNDGGSTPFDATDPGQAIDFSGRIAVDRAVLADTTLIRGGAGVPIGDTSLVVAARQVIIGDTHEFTAAGLPMRGTLTLAAATFVGNVASRTAAARDSLEAGRVAEDIVRTRLAQVSDVSIDEEMARMIQLQTAYAANARVVQTAQAMMDELLAALR